MTDTLSRIEAIEFLEGTLQIQSPMDKLREDRVGFLNAVIGAFLKKIPFQSVTAIATPKLERRTLTFTEVSGSMVTRQGGLCFEINWFMKELLQSLGYDAHYVGFSIFGKPNNHLATVVRGLLKQDDLHLVDVGSGYPIFESIPLDFEKESPIYHSTTLTHKFVKNSDGGIRWMHKSSIDYFEYSATDLQDDGWHAFMVSTLEFRSIEFFAASMENIHTVESGPEAMSPFLATMRAVDYRGGRLLAFKDTTLLEEDESGRVTKKCLARQEQMLEAYMSHFPQFSTKVLEQALQNLHLNFEG